MGSCYQGKKEEEFDENKMNEKNEDDIKKIELKNLKKLSKSICEIIVQTDNNSKNGSGFFITIEKEKKN